MKLSWWIAGYLIAVAVALLSPLASNAPDGLERVAEQERFMGSAQEAPYSALAGYLMPGIHNEALATILAGIVGVTVVYLLLAGGAYLAHRSAANRRA